MGVVAAGLVAMAGFLPHLLFRLLPHDANLDPQLPHDDFFWGGGPFFLGGPPFGPFPGPEAGLPVPTWGPLLGGPFGLAGPLPLVGFFEPLPFFFLNLPTILPTCAFVASQAFLRAAAFSAQAFFLASFSKLQMLSVLSDQINGFYSNTDILLLKKRGI